MTATFVIVNRLDATRLRRKTSAGRHRGNAPITENKDY